jgi:hypothetical protein
VCYQLAQARLSELPFLPTKNFTIKFWQLAQT